MRRLGLTDEEMGEYQGLLKKGYQDIMKGEPRLTDEEKARYAELDKRTEYLFWPCEEEASEVTQAIDSGFFLENPANHGSARPASMYFEPDEAEEYLKSHPGSHVWTLVDGDDGTEWIQQGWHYMNRTAYLIEDPEWAERMRLVDEAVKILCAMPLNWLIKFQAYLVENHGSRLLPWLEMPLTRVLPPREELLRRSSKRVAPDQAAPGA